MPRRVMSGLLRLAQSIGHENPDGLIDLPLLLVHWMIAASVGTKREAVSVQMSQLRRLGFIRYSRNRIAVDYISLNGAVHKEESMHRRSRQLPIREHSG